MLRSLKVLKNLCLPNVYPEEGTCAYLPALSIQLDPPSGPLLLATLCTKRSPQPLMRRHRRRLPAYYATAPPRPLAAAAVPLEASRLFVMGSKVPGV